MIVVGGNRVSSLTTRVREDDGTAVWAVDHGDTVYAVAVDADGNVYTGGLKTGGYTTRKYASDGTLVWSKDHGDTVYAIAVDGSGNVITGGNWFSSVTTRKYTSDGTLAWSKDHGDTVYGVATDGAGAVYAAGLRSSSISMRKYASDGTDGLTLDFINPARAIAVDSSGNIYLAGDRAGFNLWTLRKYNSAGTLQWSADANTNMAGVAVDVNGNVYTAGDYYNYNFFKYTSAGADVWQRNVSSNTCTGVATDLDGNVYLTGYTDGSSHNTWKYNSAGTLQWADAFGDMAIAHLASAVITAIPALALPLALAIPWSTVFDIAPGLPLPLALAVPTSALVGAIPPDWNDLRATVTALAAVDPHWLPYVGLSSAQLAAILAPIYTAVLTGPDSSMRTVPIQNLQCRRRLGESTWLFAGVPYTAARWAAVSPQLGGEVLVYAGMRLADGLSAAGPFLRATLTECEVEISPGGGTIQLTARVINPTYTAHTRAVRAVRSRTTDAGRRQVVCAVDPLLRPNDTVVDGMATWVAGGIEYRISPEDAVMTVIEAA